MRIRLLIVFFLCSLANAQQLQLQRSFAVKADSFEGFDQLGYAYFIKDNVLSKVGAEGSLQYQNTGLGKITRVDLTNALKIVLFYADFNTVIMTDNQLNEIGRINFSEQTDPLVVTATGIASQNKLWFYDSLSQQIGLYDYITNDYTFITPPFTSPIRHYETSFNTFQWVDDKGAWYTTDIFGKVRLIANVPVNTAIQFVDESSYITSEAENIYWHSGTTDRKLLIGTDVKTFKSFWYKDQILAIFTSDGITNYKITTP